MSNGNGGGSAFPIPRNHSFGDALFAHGDGMSLRDYFAAHYISGRAAREEPEFFREAAESAYAMADEMLKAREA